MFFYGSSASFVLAFHHRSQPGGLAYRHDHQQGAWHLSGVSGVCPPPGGNLHGPTGLRDKLLFFLLPLHLDSSVFLWESYGALAGAGAAPVGANVPSAVPVSPGHTTTQQGPAERLLQEHRLAQQHQLYFPFCAQGAHEQVPSPHAPGFYHVLLAFLCLDATAMWEVEYTHTQSYLHTCTWTCSWAHQAAGHQIILPFLLMVNLKSWFGKEYLVTN